MAQRYVEINSEKFIKFLSGLGFTEGELPLPKGRGFLSKTSKHFHSRHFEIRAVPALIL
jgi:hypothetical protein